VLRVAAIDNYKLISMQNNIQIIKASDIHRDSILSLLQAEKLPVEGITSLDKFFIAVSNEDVIGVIGLEVYNQYGLLRSLAVKKEYRNKSTGTLLITALETLATTLGLDSIYLLTETAPAYFERKGYQKIKRDETPSAIQLSAEFSSICPTTAQIMQKQIIS
jgi:amino-acid N-acetyltransferase